MLPDTIYISGPITDPQTGEPRQGWQEAFNGMADHLQQQGLKTINPVTVAQRMNEAWAEKAAQPDRYVKLPSRDDYLMMDLRLMKKAYEDAVLAGVLMLEGWEQSDGAQCEHHFARALGVPVFSQEHHGYQLNEYRAPYRETMAEGRHTLAELAAALRLDPEEFKHRPELWKLRQRLEIPI